MQPDPFLQSLPSDVGLSDAVRSLHSREGLYAGRCHIQRGKGWLIAAVLRLGGFPSGGEDVLVRVRIVRDGEEWFWVRDFDGHITRSRLNYDQGLGCVCERLGALMLWLQPEWADGSLTIKIRRLTVLGLPCPAVLLPRSSTCEWQDEVGRFRFDVSADMPGLGPLIRYQGWLTPVHGITGDS